MARPVNVRRGEAVVAVVLLALAAYVVFAASGMPAGTIALPGPGAFPIAIASLLALTAIGILVRLRRQRGPTASTELGHRDIVIALLALVGVALAFEPLGAIPTVGLLLLVLLKAFAHIAWWRAVVGALCGALATWVVFSYALGVQLPGV
jgi:hypothetical protein